MRTRARHPSPITLVAAVLLTVAATAAPADATSQWDSVFLPLEAFGADAGGVPQVKVYQVGWRVASFLAFAPTFRGGVRVAVGDIDGDGRDDVVAGAGPGGGPHVKVFRGIECPPGPACPGGSTVDPNPAASFFAFNPSFTGGVYVAVGNFDPSNDPPTGPRKRHEIVVAAGEGGGPHVKIFRNQRTGGVGGGPLVLDVGNPIASFLAFSPAFTGGVRVTAGDLNADGFADLVVGAGPGGGPHVKAFRNLSAGPPGSPFGGLNLTAPVANFFPFSPAFTGGVYVGLLGGDPTRRNIAVGAGAGAGPHVKVIRNTGVGTGFGFDLTTPFASFSPFPLSFTGGTRVGSSSDLVSLKVTPGPGGAGLVKAFFLFGGPPVAVPLEFERGLAPFDFSLLGLFPSQ